MFIDDPHLNSVVVLTQTAIDDKLRQYAYKLLYSVVQRHGLRWEYFV